MDENLLFSSTDGGLLLPYVVSPRRNSEASGPAEEVAEQQQQDQQKTKFLDEEPGVVPGVPGAVPEPNLNVNPRESFVLTIEETDAEPYDAGARGDGVGLTLRGTTGFNGEDQQQRTDATLNSPDLLLAKTQTPTVAPTVTEVVVEKRKTANPGAKIKVEEVLEPEQRKNDVHAHEEEKKGGGGQKQKRKDERGKQGNKEDIGNVATQQKATSAVEIEKQTTAAAAETAETPERESDVVPPREKKASTEEPKISQQGTAPTNATGGAGGRFF